MKQITLSFTVILCLFMSACFQRPAPENLIVARDNLRRAEMASAEELAPKEYQNAKKALDLAEASFNKDDYDDVMNHLIFVAKVKTENALMATQARTNELRAAQIKGQKVNGEHGDMNKMRSHISSLEAKLRSALKEIASIRNTDRGLTISLSNILFDFNKASLKPGSKVKLDKIANLLSAHADRMILIEGHTDSIGKDNYNRSLSKKRAKSVQDYLFEAGISLENLASRGYGENFPLATNKTPSGRQQNRRVDLVILQPGQKAEDFFLDKKS